MGRLRALRAGRARRTADLGDDEAEREAALRAVRMLGVARPAHVRAHFLRRRYRRLEPTLAALVAAGRLERVAVAGLGDGWYAAPEDVERAGELAPGTRSTALSPFDNLLCDRARAAELFGFDHRLEIYVPRGAAALGLLRPADPAPRADRRPRGRRARRAAPACCASTPCTASRACGARRRSIAPSRGRSSGWRRGAAPRASASTAKDA